MGPILHPSATCWVPIISLGMETRWVFVGHCFLGVIQLAFLKDLNDAECHASDTEHHDNWGGFVFILQTWWLWSCESGYALLQCFPKNRWEKVKGLVQHIGGPHVLPPMMGDDGDESENWTSTWPNSLNSGSNRETESEVGLLFMDDGGCWHYVRL